MIDKKNDRLPIVISNFSHVYESYNFLSDWDTQWIECSHLTGVDGMCDENGMKSINYLLKDFSFSGIHLLDNGNYHYLSYFWCSKIQEDFSLILFDHHSDMQEPQFDGVLSCGSWVIMLLKSNPHLKHVYMFGVQSDNLKMPKEFEDCVHFDVDLSRQIGELPLYVSIDLDVLSEEFFKSNWDQGTYTLRQLLEQMSLLWQSNRILGLDICGEDKNVWGHQRNQTTYQILMEHLIFLAKES